jgi:hypothetical protein
MPRTPKPAPPAEPDTSTATKPANKQDAVRLALEAGVTSPTQIGGYVKEHFGLEMTAAHASTAKGILLRTRKVKKGKPGPRPGNKRAEQASPTPARTATPSTEAGLTPHDLRLLSEMARRAGGFQRLREYVDLLGGSR